MHFKSLVQLIEKRLDQLIPDNSLSLNQAARYSTLNGGKRLRPLLVLATAHAFGAENALDASCALEMIHTYSLIHDDLPAMDNDDFRRGKPTLHKVFPESHAILAGDFLLTRAFEVISLSDELSDSQKIALIQVLGKSAGGKGMIGGQIMDLEGKELTLEEIQIIHEKKTAALMEASVLFGGIIGNASADEMAQLKTFGRSIGLAFQVIDDVLDVTNSYEKHGTKMGSDAAKNKTTYATLLGVEGATKFAKQLQKEALGALSKIDRDTKLLEELANSMIRDSIQTFSAGKDVQARN